MRARALLAVVLVALLPALAGACGGSRSKAAESTAANTQLMPGGTVLTRVYFVRGGRLAATGRRTVHTLGVANAAINALIAGPSASERKIGFRTELPSGVEQRRVVIVGGVATVELTGNLNRVARAQVVTTLTRFPTVRSVVVVTPAGSTPPLTRANFENLMPAVLVESPLPFEQVESPLRVSGTSNTFEAVSRLELLDASGKVLASKTVMASSGTGTRGTFAVAIGFRAPSGPATLVSFENSAKDGSRIDVVRIPLRISG
jgi:germination protein M